VISVSNLRNKLTIFDIMQLIVSLSGVCADVKIDALDSSEYNVKCIDMIGNVSLEFYIVVHNPAVRSILVKIFTMIQDAVRKRQETA
jgi:hypothetical protein